MTHFIPYDGSQPYPVVLVFHGGGSNAKQAISYFGLNETADRENLINVSSTDFRG